jgi:hypothetical protein
MPDRNGSSGWLLTFLICLIGIALGGLGTLNLFIVKEFKVDLTAKIDRVVQLYRHDQAIMLNNLDKLSEKVNAICVDVAKHDVFLKNGNNQDKKVKP